MGLFDTTRKLASQAVESKAKELEVRKNMLQAELEPRESLFDSGERAGSLDSNRFESRSAKRNQLKEYHKVRVDGGIIATLLEARALMVFGTGAEFTAEQDAVADWLNSQFDQLDLEVLDIGTDAYFYGYSLGKIRETRGGDFGAIEHIEPWTTIPDLDKSGDIQAWEQKINRFKGQADDTFTTDEIYHFNVMKESGRDPVGMSMLGRAMSEATAYRDNQEAIQNATKLHGFPKWHVKLGREDGAVIDDNELRRARPKFDNINELTKWVTGQDVDIETISPEGFDFEQITEHDLSKLAIAFMLPVEMTQIGGGDGLGTGFPARLRERLFLLSAQADQRTLGGQLVGLGKDMLMEYAPDEIAALIADIDDFDLRFEFDDPITDPEDIQSKITAIGKDMTVNERRKEFDLPPLDDDETGEQFEPPGKPDPAGPEDDAGIDRQLAHGGNGREDFWWEDYLAEMQEQAVWDDDGEIALFGFSEGETPAFVKAKLFQSVLEGGEIFSDVESVPKGEMMEFRMWMSDQLTSDGWTISDMQDELTEQFGMDPQRAETVARSTTQNMVSQAAEQGYRERDDFEDLRFRWPEINDGRDSEVCLNIVDAVPDGGLPLDELKDTVHEEAEALDLDPRGWTPHPNCRRRPLRVTDR